ncbi:MAG: HAMP domain-containing histidine kinase [Clostridiales bacterium]|nr:HAMP domain-containing histidine kinase [Clostridiales bacterium]
MSIRVKIFIYLCIFCSALLALLWLFQVVFLDSVYRIVKIGEVRAAMGTLEANLDSDGLAGVAAGIFEQKGVAAEILSVDGDAIYSSGQNDLLLRNGMERELSRLYALTVENGGEYFEQPLQTGEPQRDGSQRGGALTGGAQTDGALPDVGPQPEGPQPGSALPSGAQPGGGLQPGGPQPDAQSKRLRTLYHCKLIERPSGSALIVLSAVISPVDATVDTLRIELYFVTGLMLLFSLLLALLISRNVSKPIVSINESAKILAAGRYDATFGVKGYREILELSDTLSIAAKELSVADGLRRELVANISHDLRTPLTLIAGYAEAMRDLPGENTRENAQIIVDEANRLNRLVGDVLDLSKFQSGVQKLKPAPYSLTKSLRETAMRLAEFTRANGYTILFEADGDIEITADESHISQAVYNLLTNAVNFTGEDKTVTLRQVAEPGFATVEVIDTGMGVAPEELPYIWDRYYRTGKKHRRAVIGTGLGLSIVKSIVELHGGTYGAKSEPGKGSLFWFRLKRTEMTEQDA